MRKIECICGGKDGRYGPGSLTIPCEWCCPHCQICGKVADREKDIALLNGAVIHYECVKNTCTGF